MHFRCQIENTALCKEHKTEFLGKVNCKITAKSNFLKMLASMKKFLNFLQIFFKIGKNLSQNFPKFSLYTIIKMTSLFRLPLPPPSPADTFFEKCLDPHPPLGR